MITIVGKVRCCGKTCEQTTEIEIELSSDTERLYHQEERNSYGDHNDHHHDLEDHTVNLVKMEVLETPEGWLPGMYENTFYCPKCKDL